MLAHSRYYAIVSLALAGLLMSSCSQGSSGSGKSPSTTSAMAPTAPTASASPATHAPSTAPPATANAADAKQARIKNGSATMTDLHGFSLRLSWSNFGTAVNVDTTAGRPGNSVVSYHLVGQLSVTNTTPGKQAPRPQDNVNIQPLWLNDSGQFCSLVAEAVSYNPYWDGVSECDNGGNYTINGKKYIGLDFMSWRIGMQDSDMLGVGETKTYVDSRDGYYGNTWSVEIPADKAQPLAGVLRSPDIVIVTDGTSSSAGVYVNCISDLESGVCLLGGSDW